MAEYLEKQAVIEAFNMAFANNTLLSHTLIAVSEEIVDKVEVADVQPVKRGKLEERIGYGGWGDTYYHCSVCGNDWVFEEGTPKANEWNFCPHCGADVRSPDATKG